MSIKIILEQDGKKIAERDLVTTLKLGSDDNADLKVQGLQAIPINLSIKKMNNEVYVIKHGDDSIKVEDQEIEKKRFVKLGKKSKVKVENYQIYLKYEKDKKTVPTLKSKRVQKKKFVSKVFLEPSVNFIDRLIVFIFDLLFLSLFHGITNFQHILLQDLTFFYSFKEVPVAIVFFYIEYILYKTFFITFFGSTPGAFFSGNKFHGPKKLRRTRYLANTIIASHIPILNQLSCFISKFTITEFLLKVRLTRSSSLLYFLSPLTLVFLCLLNLIIPLLYVKNYTFENIKDYELEKLDFSLNKYQLSYPSNLKENTSFKKRYIYYQKNFELFNDSLVLTAYLNPYSSMLFKSPFHSLVFYFYHKSNLNIFQSLSFSKDYSDLFKVLNIKDIKLEFSQLLQYFNKNKFDQKEAIEKIKQFGMKTMTPLLTIHASYFLNFNEFNRIYTLQNGYILIGEKDILALSDKKVEYQFELIKKQNISNIFIIPSQKGEKNEFKLTL